jgi:uncharacterized protein (DUF2235 family)
MTPEKKRLVFNFDGTWNRVDSPCPTNVVLTAESVLPLGGDGIAQLNYYDQGVGTAKGERVSGGVFGRGLTRNLATAYRNLVFNYMPGDDIFVFGFSRGAFTARSFVGLIRNCGIVRREHADRTPRAIELYQSRREDDVPWGGRAKAFRADFAHPLPEIAYLGIWDTVGALGIPNSFLIASFFNRKHRFHDHKLTDRVRSARHALAIDETRRSFEPTLWEGFDALNATADKTPTDADAPYQQKWFSGVHSAVGGGLPGRGLSDQALEWVWAGARLAGLELDISQTSRVYSLHPDFTEPLDGVDRAGLGRWTRLKAALSHRLWRRAARKGGPTDLHHVSIAARRRWHTPAERLAEGKPYRPPVLDGVAKALDEDRTYRDLPPIPAPGSFDLHVVKSGDVLTRIARDRLGDPNRWEEIFAMNSDKLVDADRIYCGMTLRIPKA